MARKIAPSEMIRQQIDQTLSGGMEAEGNLLSTLAGLGMQHLLQQALEQEQEDYLGRGRYERGNEENAKERAYRNGYLDAGLATAEGEVGVRVPPGQRLGEYLPLKVDGVSRG